MAGFPNVQLASESPVIRGYVERYTFSTDFIIHFPPVSVSRPPVPRPDPGRGQASSCPLEYVADRCPWAPRHGPPTMACPRADALVECEGMKKVRSPCGSADLRETPAVPEFAQWRSAFTRCLASASSLS